MMHYSEVTEVTEESSTSNISLPYCEVTEVTDEQSPSDNGEVRLVSEPSRSGVENVNVVRARTTATVYEQVVRYGCEFYFTPEMLKYFYNAGPDAYFEGSPVLLETPEFEGGFNSKWQLNFTINKWDGSHRWMSLYLAHLEDSLAPSDLKVQCEFMVVNKKGDVLHSSRNILQKLDKGDSFGMTGFLHFNDFKRMVADDNSFSLIAQLTLIHESGYEANSLTHRQYNSQELSKDGCSISDTSTVIFVDSQDSLCLDIALLETDYEFGIMEGDRVSLLYKKEPVVVLSRSMLKAKSLAYDTCLKEWEDSRDELNFSYTYGVDNEKAKRTLREYAFYIEHGSCKTLEIGSYLDIHLLMHFANKMGSQELAFRCLTAMTMKLTPWNASIHAAAIQHLFKGQIDAFDWDVFRQYFKQLSQKPK